MMPGIKTKPCVEPLIEAAYNAMMASAQELEIPPEWLAEFEAAARRPLALRMKYAFIKTYKPVMDDAPFRAFDTTAQYREWCEKNLPDWLGYGRV
jgi:hypothetical protein